MVVPAGLFLLSMVAFALSFRGLQKAVTDNVTVSSVLNGYSRRATRIGRSYKIVAWGFLSLFLFAQFCQSLFTLMAEF